MTPEARRCARKSIGEIRENYNSWFSDVWAPTFDGNRNWFEDTNQKLFCAFGLLIEPPSAIPPRPAVLVGQDVPALGAELERVCTSLMEYGVNLFGYADAVRAKCSDNCRATTRSQFQELRNQTKRIDSLPRIPDNSTALCQQFTRWSKQYFEWSRSFRVWEIKLATCVNNPHPDCQVANEVTDLTAKLQVSPVPWPPWEDYADE